MATVGKATDGRDHETLAQATVVKGLLPYLTSDALADRDRGRRFDYWDPPTGPEAKRRIFRSLFVQRRDGDILQILLNYFGAIAARWPKAWEGTGQGNMIKRTNGYNGFMRFLRPLYRYFTSGNEIVSQEQFASILARVQIKDDEFNIVKFPPGSSGAKRLYDKLLEDTQVPEN